MSIHFIGAWTFLASWRLWRWHSSRYYWTSALSLSNWIFKSLINGKVYCESLCSNTEGNFKNNNINNNVTWCPTVYINIDHQRSNFINVVYSMATLNNIFSLMNALYSLSFDKMLLFRNNLHLIHTLNIIEMVYSDTMYRNWSI